MLVVLETAVPRSRALGVICIILASSWGLVGFLSGLDSFVNYYSNAGPQADTSFSVAAIPVGLWYMFTPPLLAALGLVYLSRGGRVGSALLAVWTGIMAACLMTNILSLLWDSSLWPMLWVPSRLDLLAISVGHLLVGIAGAGTLVLASRRILPGRGPGLVPSAGLGLAILVAGAIGFLVTGHVYYILALSWWLGAFYIGTVITVRLRSQKQIAPEIS